MDAKNKQKMAFSGKGRPLLPKMWKMTETKYKYTKQQNINFFAINIHFRNRLCYNNFTD